MTAAAGSGRGEGGVSGARVVCRHPNSPHLVCRNGICICRECLWRMSWNEPKGDEPPVAEGEGGVITVTFFCNDVALFEEHYETPRNKEDTVATWMKWNEDTADTEDVHIHRIEEVTS